MLAYPDFTKPFEIYTDASTKQLGAVITQENRPIAFFSWKLSGAQTKYTVIKLELLAIVETLKEFNEMLWGQRINVYTNHKNLTQDGLGLTSNRVTRWRILLEKYAPEIIYRKEIHNTVTDAISQLDYDPKLNSSNEYNHATHVMSTNKEACQRWLMCSKFWSCYNEMQEDPDKTNRKNLQNPTHSGIVFCYVSRIFTYFILTHVDLYFIFSHRFSVIIVSHCAHEYAHLICLIFVSCH